MEGIEIFIDEDFSICGETLNGTLVLLKWSLRFVNIRIQLLLFYSQIKYLYNVWML